MAGEKQTNHFDQFGNEVYPCRCGETHRGDYGFYAYAQHECLHESPLTRLDPFPHDLMCPECGKTFTIFGADSQTRESR